MPSIDNLIALAGVHPAKSESADPVTLQARVNDLEKSLQQLEERLATHERVFSENPIPSIIYSVEDFSILNANGGACDLYGYSAEQMCGKTLLDLFAPLTAPKAATVATELRKPLSSMTHVGHGGADGRELVVSIVSFAFEFRGRNARVAMIEDETARHNTEEALQASEERLRELFENANDVIFLHDLKGNILEINRAGEVLTGYSRQEVLGKGLEALIAPEARSIVLDIVRAHLGGSAPQHYELPLVSKNGLLRYLEVSTRILYRRGHAVAIQGIGRDVTERKQAQQRLLESARELKLKNEELSSALEMAQQATRLKEQFLANTSHELRTPMNGIMGMINLLKMTDLTPDQQEYADAVSQCSNDLLTIINDLLDLSQIEARKMSFAREAFDIYESLRNVTRLLDPRAKSKDLTLIYEFDARLPRFVYGDSVRFRQILTNLIANAVKFTLTGGVKVCMEPSEDGNMIACRVADSGIGVEESVRDRIFEAFFQADGTTQRRFGGTGLGLTISKQLVEIMGGQIGVYNNRPEPGATFWFEIPLQRAAASEVAEPMDHTRPEPATI